MQKCRITIATTVNGQEKSISRMGELNLCVGFVKVFYDDENANVRLALMGEKVVIERRGDYSMTLNLERGKMCDGSIGIGGSQGEIKTYTHKVDYAVGKDSFLLLLQYDLLIGEEIQRMKIRLLAKMMR